INSEGYFDKIKEVSSGKYSNEIFELLSPDKIKFATIKTLSNMGLSEEEFLASLQKLTSSSALDKIIETSGKALDDDFLFSLLRLSDDSIDNIDVILQKIETNKAKALEHPELYVNGEFATADEAIESVNFEFNSMYGHLLIAASVLDKEAFNNFLRMRFDDVGEYLEEIAYLSRFETELIGQLCSSCNTDNKPFMPTQKIQFIDLVYSYRINGMDYTKMQEMIASGSVDIGQLNNDLLNQIMKNTGMTESEISQIPAEKLAQWNIKYIHLLSKQMHDARFDGSFPDLIKASNLEDFESFIENPENIYGQTNLKTEAKFKEAGLDYDSWKKPSKESEVKFYRKDSNAQQLEQVASQLQEDIEALRATPAKGFIDKQLAKYIKEDSFVVPSEFSSSKAKMSDFVESVLKQLDPIFQRAQGNLSNPSRAIMAQNTLTVKDHLNQRLADVSRVSDTKAVKTLDLTIKMWDRIPQKDIFQGNYSTCCIGMGGGNGAAMPHYLLNS
ncbi:hypothetical protein IJ531_02095, partial [bacterium]|nr:hypothetical protein [bacterium]